MGPKPGPCGTPEVILNLENCSLHHENLSMPGIQILCYEDKCMKMVPDPFLVKWWRIRYKEYNDISAFEELARMQADAKFEINTSLKKLNQKYL